MKVDVHIIILRLSSYVQRQIQSSMDNLQTCNPCKDSQELVEFSVVLIMAMDTKKLEILHKIFHIERKNSKSRKRKLITVYLNIAFAF